jgi:hypothetical protein
LFKTEFNLDKTKDGVIWVHKVDNPSSFGVVKYNEDKRKGLIGKAKKNVKAKDDQPPRREGRAEPAPAPAPKEVAPGVAAPAAPAAADEEG